MVGRKRVPVAIVGAVAAAIVAATVAACEIEDGDRGLVAAGSAGSVNVAGQWSGTESITGEDAVADVAVGSIEEGVRFRVALRLDDDGRFTLRAFGFPVAGGTERRVCAGIYDRDGRTLEFFPNTVCRPLPLSRYVIGRTVPDGLTLEASTDRRPGGGEPTGDIRVRIELERN